MTADRSDRIAELGMRAIKLRGEIEAGQKELHATLLSGVRTSEIRRIIADLHTELGDVQREQTALIAEREADEAEGVVDAGDQLAHAVVKGILAKLELLKAPRAPHPVRHQ